MLKLGWCGARQIRAFLLVAVGTGCAGLPTTSERDESVDSEPPKSWTAAVEFSLRDRFLSPSYQYEMEVTWFDGRRTRVITAADQAMRDPATVRTPWYRVRPRPSFSTTLHLKIVHPDGAVTEVAHPLEVAEGQFWHLRLAVLHGDTAHQPPPNVPLTTIRYPVNPAAHLGPRDSVWVTSWPQARYCWSCPT
jgi:hypothetical protein